MARSGIRRHAVGGRREADAGRRAAAARRHVSFPPAVGRGRAAARSTIPKVEPYERYLYRHSSRHRFPGERSTSSRRATSTSSSAPNYLVTVHDGDSRSIDEAARSSAQQHAHILAEGPVALLHRIVDSMVDNYAPEIEELEEQMDELEDEAILGAGDNLAAPHSRASSATCAALRRVVIPQRDVVGRLARREFPQISDEMAYRFRDVYDHLVRLRRRGDDCSRIA